MGCRKNEAGKVRANYSVILYQLTQEGILAE